MRIADTVQIHLQAWLTRVLVRIVSENAIAAYLQIKSIEISNTVHSKRAKFAYLFLSVYMLRRYAF